MGMYYASLIFNVFLLYSIFRFLFTKFLNAIIHRCNYNTATSFFSSIVLQLLNNAPSFRTSLLLYPVSCFIFGLLTITSKVCCDTFQICGRWSQGNAFSHISVFLAGILAAYVYECLYKTIFFPSLIKHGSTTSILMNGKSPRLHPYVKLILKYILFPILEVEDGNTSGIGYDQGFEARGSYLESSLLWRFLPDLLFLLSIYLLIIGFQGKEDEEFLGSALLYIVSPYVTTTYILVSMLQMGRARFNLSRVFFESPLMNIIGNAAYPLCMLYTTF